MSSVAIKLIIKQGVPPPARTQVSKIPLPISQKPSYKEDSLILEKIKCYIEDIDSGMDDSKSQWEYIKALFLALQKRKHLSDKEQIILDLIQPTVMKYGSDDPTFAAKIEGHLLNRGEPEDNG